jgi:hypothetical protein
VLYSVAMRRPTIPLVLGGVLATLTLAGCAADSPGRYRERPVVADSPLVRFVRAAVLGEPVADDVEREALLQLEDLVECAASEVAGEPFDWPSPHVGVYDYVAELARRDALLEAGHEYYYEAFYPGDLGFGAKYLVDHAGERCGEAIDHELAPELCEAIDAYAIGDVTRGDIEDGLRELEATIREDLGIDEATWNANPLVYDAGIDWLGAFSEPSYGCPLFPRCRIELPRSLFEADLREVVHTYGHEMLHCRIGLIATDNEAMRMIEETSCEVFGAKVAAHLEAQGALAFLVELDPVEIDAGSADGETPPPEIGEDPEESWIDEDLLFLETSFARLSSLYPAAPKPFATWRRTQERYGHFAVEVGSGDTVHDQIERLMSRMSLADYVSLLHRIESLADLDAAERAATRRGSATLAEALAAVRTAREAAVSSARP